MRRRQTSPLPSTWAALAVVGSLGAAAATKEAAVLPTTLRGWLPIAASLVAVSTDGAVRNCRPVDDAVRSCRPVDGVAVVAAHHDNRRRRRR